MKKERLYLDTAVISAYTDHREPEKQEQTKLFLQKVQSNELYISAVVLKELDSIKDESRIKITKSILKSFMELPFVEDIAFLTEKYISFEIIPAKHEEDAMHIAYAVVNEMDCLVSWNFTHLVKRSTRHKVNAVNELNGYGNIEIIAPIEY